jgi:hypothetical protein
MSPPKEKKGGAMEIRGKLSHTSHDTGHEASAVLSAGDGIRGSTLLMRWVGQPGTRQGLGIQSEKCAKYRSLHNISALAASI